MRWGCVKSEESGCELAMSRDSGRTLGIGYAHTPMRPVRKKIPFFKLVNKICKLR